LAKTWTEKFTKIQSHLDGFVNEANAQFAGFEEKIASESSRLFLPLSVTNLYRSGLGQR